MRSVPDSVGQHRVTLVVEDMMLRLIHGMEVRARGSETAMPREFTRSCPGG